MPEIVVGTLLMFLGWLCLERVRRERARHPTGGLAHAGPYEEKPLMLIPTVLGVLLLLDGLALLAFACLGRLPAAGG